MPTLDNLLSQAYETLQQQTAAHIRTWGFGREASWSLDQEAGVLHWEFANARLAQAPVQIVGTLHKGIFQWAWSNASIVDALREHAKIVHAYGVEHDIDLLTQPKLSADEDQAWHYTALAMQLAEAEGAYRVHVADADLYIYMTFGQVTTRFDHTRESVPQFYQRCLDVAKEVTKTHKALWELGREKACHLDFETGTLTVTLADKQVQTPLQVVGTLAEDSFTWAWADDQIPEAFTLHAQKVREYGHVKEVAELLTPTINANADDAWQYATLASFLAKVDGIYVAQVEGKHVYVTLGELTITLTAPPIEDADEVTRLLQTYMQAMYEADCYYQKNKGRTDMKNPLQEALNHAKATHNHYWRTKDPYAEPMSIGWPSRYDLSKCHSWQCRKMRGGIQVIYAYRRGSGPSYDVVDDIINVYRLKRFENGYKIIEHVPLKSLRRGVMTIPYA